MFKLIKLATYALAGYVIYEFFQGVLEAENARLPSANEQIQPGRSTVRSGARR